MVDVFFDGSGTWFNKDDGSLMYPSSASGSLFSYPPVCAVYGVFSLTDKDIEKYRYTNSLDHVRKLLPSKHADSAFQKMVNNGIFSDEDAEHCFFKLPRKRKDSDKSRFVRRNNILVILNDTDEPASGKAAPIAQASFKNTISESSNSASEKSSSKELKPKDQKRLDSLSEFIGWLEIQVNNEVKRQNMSWFIFDKSSLDCTKEDLFQALTDWEKYRHKETDHVWNVKGWSACNKLWSRKERKEICDIADNRRGRPSRKNQDRENIFKKLNIKT